MSHTVIMRQEGLPDAGLRVWLLDADPTGIEAFADEAARRSDAVDTPEVLLHRGVREPGHIPPHVASFTDNAAEAYRWGVFYLSRQVPLARVLAVVHHPDTNTTEYVVATRGLASQARRMVEWF